MKIKIMLWRNDQMHPYVFNLMNENHLREMHQLYEKDVLVKIAVASRKSQKSPINRAFNMLIVLVGFRTV